MSYCPKCSGTMNATDTVCPHCGYDFPMSPPKKGIEYSRLADVALMFGALAAGLLCVIAFVEFASATLDLFFELARGKVSNAIWKGGGGVVLAALQFLLYFAVMVVFVRVRRISA